MYAFVGFFQFSLQAYELTVASFFRDTAPYLKEWIEYHRLVGVEHFWLYNDASKDNWEEVLKPYIDEGLVEVFYWTDDKQDWVPRQMAAFKDGVRRALGTSKWIALIDQDEFLLPMKDKTVVECLEKHFSDASAVYVNWRCFGTSGVYLKPGESLLSHLFFCSMRSHPINSVGKTIVKPESIIIDNMIYPHHFPLVPGSKFVNGDGGDTLKSERGDWHTDGMIHDKYIRMNHYVFRDETYFQKGKIFHKSSERKLVLEHYKEFGYSKDYKILNFIQKNYPEKYEKIWRTEKNT